MSGHHRQIGNRCVGGLPEDLRLTRVHEVDVVGRARQQVRRNEVRRARRIVRRADDRDGARAAQQGEPLLLAGARPGASRVDGRRPRQLTRSPVGRGSRG